MVTHLSTVSAAARLTLDYEPYPRLCYTYNA